MCPYLMPWNRKTKQKAAESEEAYGQAKADEESRKETEKYDRYSSRKMP